MKWKRFAPASHVGITERVAGATSARPRELRAPVGRLNGALCAAASAVLYTAANVALRGSVGIDPFLVSAVKAAPTVLCLTPFLLWMLARQQTLFTSLHMAPRFMLVALVGQFVGNAAFQWALGGIGLAASVPITLGTLLIGGAILGRLILGEPVGTRKLVSIGLLIIAVALLSLPGSSEIPTQSVAPIPAWAGALCAIGSGAAYALFGTVLRQSLTGGLSAPLTMWISGAVGTVSLWSVAWFSVDPSEWTSLTFQQWRFMALAGAFNFSAFVALSMSLKSLPVVVVNLINASQVAMAAVSAVIFFDETITTTLTAGIAMTFAGLAVLATRKKRTTSMLALVLVTITPRPASVSAVELDHAELRESSGLAWSLRREARVWTHNDSGDSARLFAFHAETGEATGSCQLMGVKAIDWESMAAYRDGEGNAMLIVADSGDNEAKRDHILLHLFAEPEPDRQTQMAPTQIATVRVRHAGGPVDCEAVAVDSASNTLVLISKGRLPLASVETLELATMKQAARGGRVVTARRVAWLPLPMVTGMDIDPDTGDIWLASYLHLLHYPAGPRDDAKRPGASPPKNLLQRLRGTANVVAPPKLKQIEAIAIDAGGNAWVTHEGNPSHLERVESRDD